MQQRDAERMRRRLTPVDQAGLLVRREHGDETLLNLASNDYLGLAAHPHLRQAAAAAAQNLGTGSTASRLVVGHTQQHADLEQRFAKFKHAEAALVLPTGYMANLAVLTALTQPGDLILLDKLTHASLIDAARASQADVRTYAHLNHERLEQLLQRFREQTASQDPQPMVMVVTDSVFSMDGDVADLTRIVELAERYDAMIVVDEAHGTGVLGDEGEGLCQAQGVADRIDVVISTASKALGSLGGIITASQFIIDTLVNHARSLIYTTAVPPPQLASIDAALDVIRDEPDRRERLRELSQRAYDHFVAAGWALPVRTIHTPIFPLIVGDARDTLDAAAYLQTHGILAVAIRPPTVAPGTSRIRISLRADMSDEQLAHMLTTTDALRA